MALIDILPSICTHLWRRGISCFHSAGVSVYEWLTAFLIWTWRASTYTSFPESHSLSLSARWKCACSITGGGFRCHWQPALDQSLRTGITSQARAGLGLATAPGVMITGFSRGNSLQETLPAVRLHASIAPGYNGGIPHMILAFGTDFICFESRWNLSKELARRGSRARTEMPVFSPVLTRREFLLLLLICLILLPRLQCAGLVSVPYNVCWMQVIWCTSGHNLSLSLSLSLSSLSLSLSHLSPLSLSLSGL